MANTTCPRCGSAHIKDGKCEYCGCTIETAREAPAGGSGGEESTPKASGNRKLFRCPDCGRMISRDAQTCPNCGCPDPQGKRAAAEQEKEMKEQKERRIVIILIAVLAIIALVIIWHKTNPYSMPIWLQQIIMDVRKFFGDHEYTLYYGSWI